MAYGHLPQLLVKGHKEVSSSFEERAHVRDVAPVAHEGLHLRLEVRSFEFEEDALCGHPGEQAVAIATGAAAELVFESAVDLAE